MAPIKLGAFITLLYAAPALSALITANAAYIACQASGACLALYARPATRSSAPAPPPMPALRAHCDSLALPAPCERLR